MHLTIVRQGSPMAQLTAQGFETVRSNASNCVASVCTVNEN